MNGRKVGLIYLQNVLNCKARFIIFCWIIMSNTTSNIMPSIVPNFAEQFNKNSFINQLLTGVIILDDTFNICFSNATSEQVLSAGQSQILQSSIFHILKAVDDDDNFQQKFSNQLIHAKQLYQAFIQHDVLVQGIYHAVLMDYGVSPMEIDGRFFYMIELWAKDRQTLIQQEQQQQAQHAVTRQMIRNMAHEVKNPLAGILGATQLLQRHLPKLVKIDDNPIVKPQLEKIENYLNIISSETKRLSELVSQLLGTPKLPNWQQVNIHEPIEQVLMLLANQHQAVDFVKDYDLSLPEITADKDQLIQVFFNLINNAVQALFNAQNEAMVDNPTISVQTRIEYQFTIGEIRHKSVMRVSVIDNGMGIDKALLPQIFYPLVTGRANGTGLGLALVQDIIQRHQGLIKVSSKKGQTVFHIYLPFEMRAIKPN